MSDLMFDLFSSCRSLHKVLFFFRFMRVLMMLYLEMLHGW